ncbi:MAG: 50S ribosomal protein L5 [Candidatus Sericytochromatia bacterium]|nr:50S ribosomal protein L5 [Candidatus Sericytochromatia bacterium]
MSTQALARLQEKYQKDVVAALIKEFNYENPMMVPRLEKVVVNMGLGEAVQNPKSLDVAVRDLTSIVGQKVMVTRAKKSIATFKLRAGMPIGAMCTLRGRRMYEFLDRLFTLALPRIRDFRGVSDRAFDGRGNYTLGLKEQILFPEIEYDKVDKVRGMDITFVTTARTDEEARALLRLMGMPFRSAAGAVSAS